MSNTWHLIMLIYLYFKNKIVASESEADNPKRIENTEKPFCIRFCLQWVIGDTHGPTFAYRDYPYQCAVAYGSNCSDQGNSGD